MKISESVNIDFNTVNTIIFDWGGVITNIHPEACIEAFIKLGHPSFERYFDPEINDDLFFRFETGKAETQEIYNRLQAEIGKVVDKEKLNNALCAMMLDTPKIRLHILKKLGKKYRLLLLSNTNPIHTNYYNKYILETHKINFPALFHKVYYSYKIGMRKPDPEIFNYVISDARLDCRKTLLLDDTEINIRIARSLNMQVLHLNHGVTMEKIFHNL